MFRASFLFGALSLAGTTQAVECEKRMPSLQDMARNHKTTQTSRVGGKNGEEVCFPLPLFTLINFAGLAWKRNLHVDPQEVYAFPKKPSLSF